MRKLLLALALSVIFAWQGHAQMIGATSNYSGGRESGSGNWNYAGRQVSLEGVCTIGPEWFFSAGAEIHYGIRKESGLYLGAQIGGGWGMMDSMSYERPTYLSGGGWWVSTSGTFIPIRADIGYYFGQRRVQPFTHFAPQLFFIFDSYAPSVTAFGFQTGLGFSIALTRQFSVDLRSDFDFAIASTPYGDKHGNYFEGNTEVRVAPAVKIGVTYHL